jgi:2-polyprenyl-6-methoxyphenol hydroxylase-like FAD-dependent oxidoreductase
MCGSRRTAGTSTDDDDVGLHLTRHVDPPHRRRRRTTGICKGESRGSATAAHLARRGLHVTLLEKATFPRDKVCGDGLTPRAVKQLIRLGIDVSEKAGWKHTEGLRIHGGLPATRRDGPDARREPCVGTPCRNWGSQPARAKDNGRIRGVRTSEGAEYSAPVIVAADGNSSRLGLAMGLHKRDDRPMGVAVRAYYRSVHGR